MDGAGIPRYKASLSRLRPWPVLAHNYHCCNGGVHGRHLFDALQYICETYLPYLAIGLIVWGYISAAISEGCQTFLGAEGIIQTVPLPYSVHAYRAVFRNLIVLAHSLVIIPLALLIFQIPVGWRILEIVPALILYALNGVWISVFFGMLSARYRDVPPIVANFTQVLFFLTPVIYPDKLAWDMAGRCRLKPGLCCD